MNVTKEQREAIRKLLAAGVVDVVEAANQLEKLDGPQRQLALMEDPAYLTSERPAKKPVPKARRANGNGPGYSRSLARIRAELVRAGSKPIVTLEKLHERARANKWDPDAYVRWGLEHERLREQNKSKHTYRIRDIYDLLTELRREDPDADNKTLAQLAGVSETWFRADGTVRRLK